MLNSLKQKQSLIINSFSLLFLPADGKRSMLANVIQNDVMVTHQQTVYNIQQFIQCTECYARCHWSLPMIYQSTDTDDVTGKLLSLFCPTWRAVLKMFARLFRIEQVKASIKVSRSCLQTRKRRNQGKKCSCRFENA